MMASTAARRQAHPGAARIDGDPRPAVLGAPPDFIAYPQADEGRQGRLARRGGYAEHFGCRRFSASQGSGRLIHVPPPVRVPASALGRIARPVRGEQRIKVGPNVIARQLILQTADGNKRIVLAAEHDDVRAVRGNCFMQHFHEKIDQVRATPEDGPLSEDAHTRARHLLKVKGRFSLVIVQEDQAGGVIFQQSQDQPPTLGRSRVCCNAVGNSHCLSITEAGQRADFTHKCIAGRTTLSARSQRTTSFGRMRSEYLVGRH